MKNLAPLATACGWVMLWSQPSTAGASRPTSEADPHPAVERRAFCMHKANYFLAGITSDVTADPGSVASDNPTTRFQTSFKFSLGGWRTDGRTGCEPARGSIHMMAGFTAKALWGLYDRSAPFEETNYNPEVFFTHDLANPWLGLAHLHLTGGFEHESNGEKDDRSRSWNNIYFEPDFVVGRESEEDGQPLQLSIRPRIWYITPLQGGRDQDLDQDIGYWRVSVEVRDLANPWGGFLVDASGGLGSRGDKGHVVAGAMYDPPVSWFPGIYLQVFHGYGESLLRGKVKSTEVRAGLRLVEY